MDTYSTLRAFADSWFLIAMVGFFLSVSIWACLPSKKMARRAAANIPFIEATPGCDKNCADCACSFDPAQEVNHG